MPERVLILGGGLAGLAAASALAPRGFAVTLAESRNRLGGRAGSFADPATGQLIDACQHVSMGCCTNFARFCRTVGTAHLLEPQPRLHFLTPDRRLSRLQADPWPAPFHLARGLASLHFLTPLEKLRIGRAMLALLRTPPGHDEPLLGWLRQHGQSETAIRRFWGVVLVSALNESVERLGLRYARKVFVDGFLRHRRGFEVQLPKVPLARLYGEELREWFDRHGVRLLENAAARRIEVSGGKVSAVRMRDGSTLEADWYISAVGFERLLDLLPPEVAEGDDYFRKLRGLETSPITSVHLWFDRPVMRLPHVVLVDCAGQWVFDRGAHTENGETGHYVQVVVSASRELRELGREGVRDVIAAEVRRLFPAARGAELLRAKVVTEHTATFSAVPGVDQFRPPQASPVPNLFVAGDWTATGWPATMEGAVRSGYLAAEALLRAKGTPAELVQPDLG
ncbi:MAG TPA: hydroxysqualene dehydroxylase HpnE [Gemmataceae bacterium]